IPDELVLACHGGLELLECEYWPLIYNPHRLLFDTTAWRFYPGFVVLWWRPNNRQSDHWGLFYKEFQTHRLQYQDVESLERPWHILSACYYYLALFLAPFYRLLAPHRHNPSPVMAVQVTLGSGCAGLPSL